MNGRRQDLSELGLVLVTSTELEAIPDSSHQSYQRIHKDEEADKTISISISVCMCVCVCVLLSSLTKCYD